jgi:hypothetical protein
MIPGNHGNYCSYYEVCHIILCSDACSFLLSFANFWICYALLPWKCHAYFWKHIILDWRFKQSIRRWTDWFDGLNTFIRYICHKSWLGGWFLPQKKSYFALKLPNGWWVFGLDQALHGDIDVYQFKYFAELCQQKVISFSDLHGISSCVKVILNLMV